MAWIRDTTVTEVTTATADPSAQVEFPTHQTNDLLLMMLAQDATAGTIPSLPAGFTDIQNGANGTNSVFRLCYKLAASSSEVCPTLSGQNDEWHIIVIAVAGVDQTTPINTSAERTVDDATSPYTWVASASTGAVNCLIFQFLTTDGGMAPTCVTMGYVNLVNGDAGTCSAGCAYKFQPSIAAIPDATWIGRTNDNTLACLVALNDDGGGTRPPYADPLTSGAYLRSLGSLVNSDTNPGSLALGAIGMRDFDQFWAFDGGSTYVDDTTDINDPGSADVGITNAVGAIWYFGSNYRFNHMMLNRSTAQSGGTIVWEYYNGSWVTLPSFVGALTATGWVRATWPTPSDWATVSVNGSAVRYWVRMRVTATFTTPPVLSQGHVGGWGTVFDAIAITTDAGVNPYMDGNTLSPAQASTFGGSELQFGSAQDMDTGVLVLHHYATLPRDYAVDPAKCREVYPITEVGAVGKPGTLSGYGGVILVLADANSAYEAYSIHGKYAKGNQVLGYNVAAMGLNDGAKPYGKIGALNKSAVTRILMLANSVYGTLSFKFSTLLLVGKVVVAGGDATNPINIAGLTTVVNGAIGVSLMLKGVGDFRQVYAPLQFGGGGQIKTLIDGAIFQFPQTYDGQDFFDWNANDNVAGVQFYGQGSADELKFPNCAWKGGQPFRWEFNASHAAAAVLDFTGNTVVGATVTLRSVVALSQVKFSGCPAFTLNGAALSDCEFVDTKVDAASPGDADNISASTFKKTFGTRHGLEIGGSAADMTLTDVSWEGFASSDGSTGNEAIYFNISSGTVNLTIIGGTVPSVRTAGATINKIINPVTLTLTNLEAGSEVRIYDAGTTDELDGTESSGTTFGFTYIYSAQSVDIVVLHLSKIYFRLEGFAVGASDADLPISQQVDRQYENP